MHKIRLKNDIISFEMANDLPFALFGGVNVLESRDMAFRVCEHFQKIAQKLDIPYVFKASFDKANRSSLRSYRGPGMAEGLALLSDIKTHFGVPILTDIHEPHQADPVAEVADILQIPAFLARQTDLVVAAAKTKRVINIKKPQFLSPQEMPHILDKCRDAGNDQLLLCERGTSFGYNGLVVDMLGMDLMRPMAPVIFDATHALQVPGGQAFGAGGRRAQAGALARAGLGLGIAGLFLEAHPDPDSALCDGPSALPLAVVEPYLMQMKALDELVKSFPPLMMDPNGRGD